MELLIEKSVILNLFRRMQNQNAKTCGNRCKNRMKKKKTSKKLYGPFLWMGSTASGLQPLRGGSLLFTTKFPEIPGTHFIDLGRMNGLVDLEATQWF